MIRSQSSWLLCALSLVCGAMSASAQEWTRFRGPNGTGESEATLPAEWTDRDYNWKIELPGIGHSSPVLWGNRLFIMSATADGATRYTLCYDAQTGKKIWEHSFPSRGVKIHKQSSYASSTAAVDENHVYFTWADPDSVMLVSLKHDGDTVWKRDLGPWSSQHGYGTSPMVYQNLVILSNSQEGKDGSEHACYLAAFDTATGEDRWKTKRNSANTSYSVPAIFEPKSGSPQLVSTNTGDGMFALDPLTGNALWSNAFFDKRTVSSPLVKGDLIFGSNGSGGGGNYLVAARSDGTEPKLAYKVTTQAPYVPISVSRGDLLFMVSDTGGIASCIDLKSGNSRWQQRIGGNHSSSPVRANDKVYFTSMDGEVVALAADKTFKELGRTSLGEETRSTPAIADGRMYFRTVSHLMSIGGKNAKAGSKTTKRK